MVKLCKLEEIKDLRTVWPHESLDFTPWLAKEKNISILADALDIDITVEESESNIGDFNVDIFALETGTDRKIIIENQLECSNHDHLGKVITYAAGKTADIVVWIVKQASEEHRAAIEWLNNHIDEKIGFFLCEVKFYKIENSGTAVKFEVVEKPNDWSKEVKKSDSDESETKKFRYNYWVDFQDYAFQNKQFSNSFRKRKPSKDHWINFSLGSSICHLAVLLIPSRNELAVELNIPEDKDFFHRLYQNKQVIETETDLSFNWLELPEKKSSRIIINKSVDFNNFEQRVSQYDWLIDVMIKMKNEFKKYF